VEIAVEMPNLDLNENIAEVMLNPKTKHIVRMVFHQKHLRFACQRCAIFCCKLGGPKLTQRDIERIGEAGYPVEDFVEPVSNKGFKGSPVMLGSLRNREDGSCVFLKFDEERNVHECSIYDVRPALCRLYPFHLEKIGPQSFLLKLIPCCKGLNAIRGEVVNEEFVTNHLLGAILDLIIKCNMPVDNTSTYAENVRVEAVTHLEDHAECVTNGEK